jgi:hypothetical protein
MERENRTLKFIPGGIAISVDVKHAERALGGLQIREAGQSAKANLAKVDENYNRAMSWISSAAAPGARKE